MFVFPRRVGQIEFRDVSFFPIWILDFLKIFLSQYILYTVSNALMYIIYNSICQGTFRIKILLTKKIF